MLPKVSATLQNTGMLKRKFLRITEITWLIVLSLSAISAFGQGSNTCAGAAAAQLSLPFTANNQSTCGDGNDYNGANACAVATWGNNFGGADWIYAFTPNQNGYLNIVLNDFQATGWVFPTIALYSGCPGTPGSCIAWAQGSTWLGNATLLQQVNAGTTYYLVVDAFTYSNFYASCYQFDINISLSTITVQPSCTNMGFGSGNFSGWTGTTGTAVTGPTGASTPTYNATALAITNGRQTIMNGGNDPCGGFPRVDPLGGPFSVRLGNNNTGAEAEQLMQTFMVSPNNSSFTYRYAVVFEDPGHTSQEQPFFKALLRDQTGAIIPCSEFIVSAAANLPGFFNSTSCSGVRYKPWSSVNVDLSNYLGQQVTVEFTAGDCSQGGHFGYAYIDAACAPSTLSALADTICAGETVTLTAPTGYQSYTWNPGNITGQSITVSPNTSTNYTLNLVAFNGCVSQFQIPITVAPQPQASFTWQAPACDLPVQLQSTSSVSTGSISSQNWSITSGNPATSTQNVVNVQFPGPGPGTYPVTLSVVSDEGCTAQTTQNVVVPPCEFRVAISGDTICPGQCITMHPQMSYGIPPYTFSWSDGSTDSIRTVCPTETTIYTITVTDALGDVASDTAQVTISNGPVFQAILENPSCFAGSNGSINPDATGFGPFTYQWQNGSTNSTLGGLSAGQYALTVTDRFGCASDTLFSLIEPNQLAFALQTISSTCNQANGIAEAINVSGGTPGYTYSLNGSTPQLLSTFVGLAPGTYSLVVADTAGCSAQQTITIDALSFPSLMTLSMNAATCENDNGTIQLLQINGGIAPFVVSFNSGQPQAFTGSALNFNQLSDSTHTISITDASGCTLDSTLTINRIHGPNGLTFSTHPATCGENNADVLINAVLGGTPNYLFAFNGQQHSGAMQYDSLAPGQYPLQVIDSLGCAYDTLVSIIALPDLNSVAATIQHAQCYGGAEGSAQVSISSGSAPFVIQWSNGQTEDLASGLSAGTYSVVVSDSVGCIDQHSIIIEQPDSLQFTLLTVHPVCNLNNGELVSQNASGGVEPYQFSLSNGTNNSTGQFSNLAAGTWSVTLLDAHQCSTQRQTTLIMPSVPGELSLESTDAVCSEANGTLQISGVMGGISPFSISINAPPDSVIQIFPLQLSALPEGTYQIRLRDANGCEVDTTLTIAQHPGPSMLTISDVPATCGLNNASLSVDTTTGGTAPFSFSLNQSVFNAIDSWTGLTPGNYLISVRDSNGCMLDTTAQIVALENVSANAFVIQPVSCFNGMNGAAQINILTGYPPFSVSWSNGDTGLQADSLAAGSYTASVSDNNGCVQSYTIELNNPIPVSILASGPDQLCEGDSLHLSAAAEGGTGHLDITWPAYSHSGENLNLIPTTSTFYTARVNDANGCEAEDSVFVHLREKPIGTISPDRQEGCSPLCVDFSVLYPQLDTIVSYVWNFGAAGNGNQALQKVCFTQSGNPQIQVEISNQFGCKSLLSATGMVTVHPVPYAAFSFTPDKPDITEPRVQFFNESTDATQFRWAFGDGSISLDENPQHLYPDTGNYTACLRVNSAFGCSDTVCQPLKVEPYPTIFAPNVFTPNQDGTNERFKIVVTYATDFRLEIYDRWGELIHVSTNPDEGWDGTYMGREVQSDVYVWKAYVTNALQKQRELIGRVSVIE